MNAASHRQVFHEMLRRTTIKRRLAQHADRHREELAEAELMACPISPPRAPSAPYIKNEPRKQRRDILALSSTTPKRG